MPSRLGHELLHRDETLSVCRYVCAAREGEPSGEEMAGADSVAFVRRGSFVRESWRGRATAAARQAVFFNRHEPYRVRHPQGGGDECVVVTLADPEQRAWLEGRDRPRVRGDHGAFPWTAALTDDGVPPRLHALLARIGARRAEPVEVQDRVFDLLAGVRLPARVPAPPARDREWIEEARVILAGHLHEPSPLRTAAAALGLSHFYLCRLFRRRLGISLHRYVVGLRLREALARLADGAGDLTTVALDLGFSDHSHFTRTFRQAFGTTPSRWRRAMQGGIRPGTSRARIVGRTY